MAKSLQARIDVLHAHVGSGVKDVSHWAQLFAQLAQVADDIGSVKAINLGGGLSVPYHDKEDEFDIDALAHTLHDSKSQWPQYALWMEPGRFMVAQCGVLLTHIAQVVSKLGVRRVGLDAGMNALMRPALYEAKHRIVNLSRVDQPCSLNAAMWSVRSASRPTCWHAGCCCRRNSQEGDVMLIDTAGAYGFVMANQYNQRALPREEILDV